MAIIKDESNNNTVTTKARYWVGVGYPENMLPDWQEVIGEVTQLPYVYCIHDKDMDGNEDDRKTHVHIMLAFPNTTTYKTALGILQELSAPGRKAFNTVQKVNNVRYMYNYLIHDTEDSRKKHKHLYDKSERVSGNNFDIGNYEQLSLDEKKGIRRELAELIFSKGYTNYLDFYMDVVTNFPAEYEDVVCGNSGHFARLTNGMYQKMVGHAKKPDIG